MVKTHKKHNSHRGISKGNFGIRSVRIKRLEKSLEPEMREIAQRFGKKRMLKPKPQRGKGVHYAEIRMPEATKRICECGCFKKDHLITGYCSICEWDCKGENDG